MNAIPFVRLADIKKARGNRSILDHFSFDVMRGEFVVLRGRSGSGKTTILRLIAGLETPDNGEIWVGNELAAQAGRNIIPPGLRRIGFVFQDLALWPHLTVSQSLAFVLSSSGMSREARPKRISEMLSVTRIEGLGDRYPHQLSGGEQQRAALARALAPNPQLLLLDEPMSSLDADLKSELAAELGALHRRLGLTTIYVTHDVSEIQNLADRTIALS